MLCRKNLAGVDEERCTLLDEIDSHFAPLEPECVVVLDSWAGHRDPNDDPFAEVAFSRDCRHDQPLPVIPSHLEALISNGGCQLLIWMSAAACGAEPRHFAWIYAHERQHLHQYTTWPRLKRVNEFVSTFANCGLGHGLDHTELPIEVDAERAAATIVKSIFGEHSYREYWNQQRALSPERAAYLTALEARLETCSGDVVKETTELLQANGGGLLTCLRLAHKRKQHLNVDVTWLVA